MEFEVGSYEDLKKPVQALISKEPHLIFLKGELGAGKTTFVSELVKVLDPTNFPNLSVMSPTYSILNEYPTSKGLVSHFDLYRLNEKSYDLEDVVESIEESEMTFIEWAEKLPELREVYSRQKGVYEVEILKIDKENKKRKLTITSF